MSDSFFKKAFANINEQHPKMCSHAMANLRKAIEKIGCKNEPIYEPTPGNGLPFDTFNLSDLMRCNEYPEFRISAYNNNYCIIPEWSDIVIDRNSLENLNITIEPGVTERVRINIHKKSV